MPGKVGRKQDRRSAGGRPRARFWGRWVLKWLSSYRLLSPKIEGSHALSRKLFEKHRHGFQTARQSELGSLAALTLNRLGEDP